VHGAGPLIGSTAVMQALRAQVERVAATDFTVLIEGESGTGKELVARQLHDLSRRRKGPFVAVNCAALVETLLEAELFGIEERTATGVRGRRGKFEHADNGTLFLDEVSDLSLSAQAKLLRVLQDLAVERVGGHGVHRLDTRIVAATNRPLSDLVARGLFRPDLYYRLSGVEIHVPPLRSRRDDVAELARFFLGRHRGTRELTLSSEAEHALSIYPWPGNVRELERLTERALALVESDRIELDDLPPRIRGEFAEVLGPSLARDESMRAWASRYARLVFDRCGGNKRRTCGILNISYHTLEAYLRVAGRHGRGRGRRLRGPGRRHRRIRGLHFRIPSHRSSVIAAASVPRRGSGRRAPSVPGRGGARFARGRGAADSRPGQGSAFGRRLDARRGPAPKCFTVNQRSV